MSLVPVAHTVTWRLHSALTTSLPDKSFILKWWHLTHIKGEVQEFSFGFKFLETKMQCFVSVVATLIKAKHIHHKCLFHLWDSTTAREVQRITEWPVQQMQDVTSQLSFLQHDLVAVTEEECKGRTVNITAHWDLNNEQGRSAAAHHVAVKVMGASGTLQHSITKSIAKIAPGEKRASVKCGWKINEMMASVITLIKALARRRRRRKPAEDNMQAGPEWKSLQGTKIDLWLAQHPTKGRLCTTVTETEHADKQLALLLLRLPHGTAPFWEKKV